MRTDERYDEDEVLIVSGRIADEVVKSLNITGHFSEDEFDLIRNEAADAAEIVMKAWKGVCEIPLDPFLQHSMVSAARGTAFMVMIELGATTETVEKIFPAKYAAQ